eukprot:UN25221
MTLVGFGSGHISGAVSVPELGAELDDNQDWASQREESCKSLRIFVICYGGGFSFLAADYLVQNGFTNIYTAPENMYGMTNWIDAGYETRIGWSKGTTVLPCEICGVVETPGSIVIDVRTESEWDEGHLACATRVELATDFTEERLSEVTNGDFSALVVLYCRSGNRAGVAKE